MIQSIHRLHIATRGKGLYAITRQVADWVSERDPDTGLLTLFIQHTSASLTIQENADPTVTRDLNEFFERIAPENEQWYKHDAEGSDDMPAHIRAALTATQISIPVLEGALVLGNWQGIFVFEHREAPHRRSVVMHLIGE